MSSRSAFLALLFGTLALFAALASCGDRTGLLVDEVFTVDASPDHPDVIHVDHRPPVEEDAVTEDALPPLDVIHHDAPDLCPDAGSTLIYVVSEQNNLMSFYPPTAQFTTIGLLACPDPGMGTPFSMAVNRKGTAYVVFSPDGNLFRVSTLTAACAPLPYMPGQSGFVTFGMGFVADKVDAGETLYVAKDNLTTGLTATLGHIDTTTFLVTPVGDFGPTVIPGPELTGTGDGRLFAFYSTNGGADSAIAEIDPATANVIASSPLPGVSQGAGWAFGFWGGDFYTFTSPMGSGNTTVTRFRPADNSITVVAQTDPGIIIVGAGVSTCAPQ